MRSRKSIFPLALVVTLLAAFGTVHAAADDTQAHAEVTQAIDAWRQAVVDKDRAGLERAYHEDLIYGHTDGVVVDKQGQIDRTVVPERDFTAVDVENLSVLIRGDQAYVTAVYTFHIQAPGEAPRQARLSGLDVWVKGEAGWQLIGRQLTRPAQ